MKIVTNWDEFYAMLCADPRDIMPRSEPDRTVWMVVSSQRVYAIDFRGYRTRPQEPRTFHVYAD